MPTSVVLGGAGFIGSHLCKYLLDIGHEVFVFDNLISGDIANLDRIRSDRLRFIKQDVTEHLYIVKEIDYVLNLASLASPLEYFKFPIQTLKVSAMGTHKALGLSFAKNARFLLVSTSEVYGDPLESPQHEDYHGNVDQLSKRGVQDEARRFAEALTMSYHRYHGVDTRIARIYNTYGPYMKLNDGRAVSTFLLQALKNEPITVYGDGTQRRTFCFVTDIVEGIYKLLKSDVVEPVNIGNPEVYAVQELAEKIIILTNSKSKIVYSPRPVDDPNVRHPDISRAKKLLDWEPKIVLEDGLKLTIEWFKKEVLTK
ncbi:MAG: GDP-mannose 4,6-dehydratase [Candidatus Hodarchaeota archaeon]